MTDQPIEDRDDAPEQAGELQEEQQDLGDGRDEGEREETVPEE
jgi:hypothetical protein